MNENQFDVPAVDFKTQVFGREFEQALFVLEKTQQLLKANIRTMRERLDHALKELESSGFNGSLSPLSEVQSAAVNLEQLRRSYETQRDHAEMVKAHLRQIARQS